MAKIDKSKWNLNVKVSQATIDQIKKMGRSKALGIVNDYNNPMVRNLPGNKEIVEGIGRLYGHQYIKGPKGATSGPLSANTGKPKKSTGSNTVAPSRRPSLKK